MQFYEGWLTIGKSAVGILAAFVCVSHERNFMAP
jgi:hypothetical protein